MLGKEIKTSVGVGGGVEDWSCYGTKQKLATGQEI